MKNKEPGKPYKLGIFVTFSLAVFVAAIYLIGERQRIFGASFRINAVFKDVGGLQIGNNIRFAGVNIGTVESIEISGDNSVKVGLLIDEKAKKFIKKDSVAGIGAESMMGNKVVVLSPGSEGAEEVSPGDAVEASATVSMDEILKQFKRTTDNAVLITSHLSDLLGTIRTGKGAAGKLLHDEEFAADMAGAMRNFKDASAALTELATGARKSWLLWGAGKTKAEKEEEERKELEEKISALKKERDEKAKEEARQR